MLLYDNINTNLLEKQNLSKQSAKKINVNHHTFSLIIPAYNEEERIGNLLLDIKKNFSEEWEVIVICDGTDKTAEIARTIDQRFKVLCFDKRLGKGGATKLGFKVASGDVVGYVDADGSISWEYILKVFNAVKNDGEFVAIGSRWMKNSSILEDQSILRLILGRLYHYFAIALLKVDPKDPQCGIKAYKKEVIMKIINKVEVKNLSFDTAFLFHARKEGYNVSEIPIAWAHKDGSKVSPLKTSIYMLITLLGIRISNSFLNKKFNLVTSIISKFKENSP